MSQAHQFRLNAHALNADMHGYIYRCTQCQQERFHGAWRGDQQDVEAGYLTGPRAPVWRTPGEGTWRWWKEDGQPPACQKQPRT